MPCYHPITGYQRTAGGPLSFDKGHAEITFRDYRTLQVPCGQCHGCRMKTATDWAIRCMHEKQMHRYNAYITLTLNDENLPPDLSLDVKTWQAFMKRLRKAAIKGDGLLLSPSLGSTKHLSANSTTPLGGKAAPAGPRFYMGAEYGELYGRPHYHACIFGLDFSDKIYLTTTPAGGKLYQSNTLDKIWGKGYASTGELTFKSAAYIARYIMKKRTGDGNRQSYHSLDLETGEIYIRRKEFNNMSRRPGIGKTWLDKFTSDAYPTGKVIINGHTRNTPRYYDKLFNRLNRAESEHLQYVRYVEQLAHATDHTDERLAVQEQVALAKTKSLQRRFE